VGRRTTAKHLCDSGGVRLNQRVAKASSLVSENDTLDILIDSRRKTFKILKVPAGQVSRKVSSSLYVLTGESIIQDPLEPACAVRSGPTGL
jgi:ribosomal 50S subunit-recycling heat shock protein